MPIDDLVVKAKMFICSDTRIFFSVLERCYVSGIFCYLIYLIYLHTLYRGATYLKHLSV